MTHLSKFSEKVIVLGQVPEIELPRAYRGALRKYLVAQSLSGQLGNLKSAESVSTANNVVESVVRNLETENVEFLNTYQLFLWEDNNVKVVFNEAFLYSDYHHINNMSSNLIFESILRDRISQLEDSE